jgi:hypothetical protein
MFGVHGGGYLMGEVGPPTSLGHPEDKRKKYQVKSVKAKVSSS